jgi:hypothetical protein
MPGDLTTGWRQTRTVDNEKGRKGGGNRKLGLLHKLDDMPCKIHFQLPEKPYIHFETNSETLWRTGLRYFVPGAGMRKKGAYIEVGPRCVIEAYRNPAEFKLNIEPSQFFRDLNPQVYYAVAAWVEEWFHLVPEKGVDGTEYHPRRRCTGRDCEFCQKKFPKVFGKHVYLEIPKQQWNGNIFTYNDEIQQYCSCGGFVYATHYECPGCHTMLIDVANACGSCEGTDLEVNPESAMMMCKTPGCNTEWSLTKSGNPNVNKAAETVTRCSCGWEGLPQHVLTCTECGEKATPYNIFDCQMVLAQIPTKDGKYKDIQVKDVKIQEADARLFDVKFQNPDKEQAMKDVEWMKKPLDLDKMLAPVSPDQEAQLLNVANPFTEIVRDGGPQFRQYVGNKPIQQEEPAEEEAPQTEEAPSSKKDTPKIPNTARTVGGRIGIRR